MKIDRTFDILPECTLIRTTKYMKFERYQVNAI